MALTRCWRAASCPNAIAVVRDLVQPFLAPRRHRSRVSYGRDPFGGSRLAVERSGPVRTSLIKTRSGRSEFQADGHQAFDGPPERCPARGRYAVTTDITAGGSSLPRPAPDSHKQTEHLLIGSNRPARWALSKAGWSLARCRLRSPAAGSHVRKALRFRRASGAEGSAHSGKKGAPRGLRPRGQRSPRCGRLRNNQPTLP